MYLAFNGDDSGDFLCSNLGWREFSEWGRGLDHKESPNLSHLSWYGWCGDPAGLRRELEAVEPPADEDVAATLASLKDQLASYGDADAVAVTDGMSED
jgi:hypothetical protein